MATIPTAWFRRRSVLFGLSMVVVLASGQFMPPTVFRAVQGTVVTVMLPFQNLFAWGAFELHSLGQFVVSVSELKADNERLRGELRKAMSEQGQLVQLQSENEALRREVELPITKEYQRVVGAVIARGDMHQAASLWVNRGEAQGIRPGMPVVAEGSILIGTVTAVTPFASEVRLLSHHESIVGAHIDGVDNHVVVRGDHDSGLLLDLIRSTEKIAPGAVVISSGAAGDMPAGLYIGTVERVRPSPDQLFEQAVIVSPLRADEVRFVSILTHF